jgi:hypothetical protein
VVDSKSFDLRVESGELVRVVLEKNANFRVETDAHETNTARRRFSGHVVPFALGSAPG